MASSLHLEQQTYGLSIRKENGCNPDSWTYVPVAIIGAGESGIAMGCRLKEKLGFDQFRIFDRQSGIGGTWYINRYPGVACDIPAIFYSFSFCPNHKWIGSGDLSESQRKQKILDEGADSVYLNEEKVRAKIVVSGVGALVEPKKFPSTIPGTDDFQGDIFHSSRWRYDVDLKDKDIIVVGTGCSAAQFVPRLTEEYGAKSVTQLMRSPPWVSPRVLPPFGNERWEKYSPWVLSKVPLLARSLRLFAAATAETDLKLFGGQEKNEKYRHKVEQDLLKWMKRTVPEKYHEILTPDYGVGCKRIIWDATWFPGLNNPKIDLTTLPLKSLQEKSVTLGPGRTYPDPKDTSKKAPTHQVTIPADVIILANGFEATQWFHPIEVIGKGGKRLHDVFEERGGPQMYQGTAMDGFPNFFAIFGPNTATGHTSVILASENMVEYSLRIIKPILKGNVETVEVKKSAEIAYTTDLQRALKNTVWQTGGCNSWYKSANGWNSLLYPYSQIWFGILCMFPKWRDWDLKYTSKGILKRRSKALLKYSFFAALITGAFKARSAGIAFRDVPALVKAYFSVSLMLAAGALESLSDKL